MSAEILAKIAEEVAECTKCHLCKGRTKTVPGEGSPEAKIMFIGEAPGYHEDIQGKPFVGQSGQLLEKMLVALGYTRQDVFIANVIKCRPPDNRDPQDSEIAACKSFLDRQIAALNPRLIVTLGRFSMRRWFPNERISQIHGKPKEDDGRIVMPMFHPAAALRDRIRTYNMFREDAFTIPDLLKRAEELALTELWSQTYTPIEKATPEISVQIAEQRTELTTQSVNAEIVADIAKEEKPPKIAKPRKKKQDEPPAEQLTLF
ncbi:uracil-DNA glycosylase [Candidatus Chlorohelix sp.]|uniref:uracil-DNA glycosylase n=1 Tax=Candidatus Chlorohelix sp. TaxID=3139201 RepID=UPI00303CA4AE